MATADDAVKITAGTVGRVNHFLKTKPLDSKGLQGIYGGRAGIRTLGRVTPSIDFESIPFDHSGTSSPSPTSLSKEHRRNHLGLRQLTAATAFYSACYNNNQDITASQ